jgi:1-deoxy-D-xylulose-5-phosphate reductoisomerase
MAACNAANEVAVAAFLAEQIRFTDIPVAIEYTLEQVEVVEPHSLSVVESADAEARRVASEWVAAQATGKNRVKLA